MLGSTRGERAVFRDPSGRRARYLTRIARAFGGLSSLLGLTLVMSLLVPSALPKLAITDDETSIGRPQFAGSLAARQRILARRQLYAALVGQPAAPALGREVLPVHPAGAAAPSRPAGSIVAGFYVNWDDKSFASLKTHLAQLDWVVCEWAAVNMSGASVTLAIDRRVPYLVQRLPPEKRPKLMLMVTNYDSSRSDFNPEIVRNLVSSSAHRRAVVGQLTSAVQQYGLDGVMVDFESLPAEQQSQAGLVQFVRELRAALQSVGGVVSQAVDADADARTLRRYADANDYIVLMLYDEHAGPHDIGPVASQGWYAREARRAAAAVPLNKLILGVGAYGYDWDDADPNAPGDEQTFQDAMSMAHQRGVPIRFDSTSLNPYLTWTDPDSTEHVLWYLDGVTAYNQLLVGRSLGVAGSAIWRLGSEDPSMWSILGDAGRIGPPDSLRSIPAGYDVQFRGSGELLKIAARPTRGAREITIEPTTHVISFERVTSTPLPYVVQRSGNFGRRVALTFDDGPDGAWTSMILDTLRSRHAPATFFLIGKNVERHISLTRRIVHEGHEVGNHTFTHPNLALTSAVITRLELNATERVIEAVLGRQTAFFRPPYFGDAEPTTADELVPVGLATDLGYVTAGLHVDSDDWEERSPRKIVANVLEGRLRASTCTDSLHQDEQGRGPLELRGCSGSVVLLHDGGGNRAPTVKALGPLIDSLRAHGDTIVLLSSLAGVTREAAMPIIPPSSVALRIAELATFGTLGAIEWVLYWIFLLAVILGFSRLAIVICLAVVQRYVRREPSDGGKAAYTPIVSVVIPAFREERVIVRTIASLLEQDYAGELEIVMVDDGSPDRTFEAAEEAFRDNPRVAVHRKTNGGKASALNYGIARARGEIIIGLDADTMFRPDTVRRLIPPLADPRVGAVAGNAKVGNRINLVTRWQAVEYVTSQNLDRRAFALLDCITVVPGAVGAWRKSVVDELGGFSQDTLAEDQDLTIAIHRAGYSVAFAADAIGLTEAPDTLRGLVNQRFRWSFGTLQCMWKHRAILLRRRFGALGTIAMPNVWLFQLLFPAVSPIADLLFVWSLFSVWLMRLHHGSTYAMNNLERVLMLYGVFLLVDWIAALCGFMMEKEEWPLTWLVLTQRFVYRQIMYFVVLRSFRAAIRGRMVGWGSLERKATVALGGE